MRPDADLIQGSEGKDCKVSSESKANRTGQENSSKHLVVGGGMPRCGKTLGATSRHMMFLDSRNPEGRFEIERKKLSRILSMFYFITDEELADIGYEQQGYASTGAEGIARAGRNIEQGKQAFATIF